ncbi:MAG TPA: DUF3800 domain-containing protein [Steroidobacteraceae bacterium]
MFAAKVHMPRAPNKPMCCFVDESIHESLGFVVTAFVFGSTTFEDGVKQVLQRAGLRSPEQEFKSSTRMDANPQIRLARDALMSFAAENAQLAIFFGPFNRQHLGRQALQALQSVVARNAISPSLLTLYFDQGIFLSRKEAERLHGLFHFLKECQLFAHEDSRARVGIQVADAVAHSFGQILRESLTGARKAIDVGGPESGYHKGTEAPLGWALLTSLRHAMFTRPVVYNGQSYCAASDPVVLDPERDDPVTFGQHPVLLGWGVQVAPESGRALRRAVEDELGRLWLGCVH